MKNILSIATAAGLCVSLAGCFSTGKDFVSETSWIKDNTTRQDDVRRLMGDPFSVGSSSGVPTWTYGYYRYELFGGTFTKELKFYWNKDYTVQNYSFTSSFPEDVKAQSRAEMMREAATPGVK